MEALEEKEEVEQAPDDVISLNISDFLDELEAEEASVISNES